MAEPRNKKVKIEPRQQIFLPSYKTKFPGIVESKKGSSYAFCKSCKCDFSISRSGSYDIKCHVSTMKHKNSSSSTEQSRPVTSFFSMQKEKDEMDFQMKVMSAETVIVDIIAELNLPISTSDTLSKAIKKMCPDSKIAQAISCCRTKTTAIIKDLSKIHQATLFSRMRNAPFTISTDGSNDAGDKMFPLVVRTVNPDTMLVESEMVALPVCEGSATGENIFLLIEAIFTENQIPWSNCLAFGCDNASVMTGKHKGVFSFIKKKNPHVFLAGCTLHLAHLAAEKAADLLPISASDLLVDIYYYFHKSVSRQHRFSEFQDFYDQDQEAILKHVPTRWLSIDRCLDRLMKNWMPLKSFFRVEASELGSSIYASTKTRVQRITISLSSPSTHLYLLFLQYTNKLFNTFLLTNQSDAPQIQNLRKSMMTLLRTFLTKFVKPNALAHKLPHEVEFNLDYNVRCFEDILTGEQVENFIKNKSSNGLKDHRIEEFKIKVVEYYRKVCTYIKDNMPFEDTVLSNIEVCDISTHSDDSLKKLRNLLERYPCLIPKSSNKDEVLDQFIQFQADCAGKGKDRADETWASVSGDYPGLSHVMLSLLTMPHSSAHCERVFSCVRKNRTDFRASLNVGTIEALMVLKHRPNNCLSRSYSPAQLKHLKGSCARSLASIHNKQE